MKKAAYTGIFFLWMLWGSAADAQGPLTISPQFPKRNQSVTISYNTAHPDAVIPDTVKNIDLVLSYSNLYEMPSSIPLQKNGNVWQATFALPRYFLFASFYLQSGAYIQKADSIFHYTIQAYENNKPVPKSTLQHGYSLRTQLGKRADLADLQAAYYKKEIELYPDTSYEARLALLMYEYNKENNAETKARIKEKAFKTIEQNFLKNPGNSGNVNQTTMGYLIIGENSRVDSIRAVVRRDYLRTQAGYDLYIDSVARLQDTAIIVSTLEKLLRTEKTQPEYLKDAHYTLFRIYAKKRDARNAARHLKEIGDPSSPYYPSELKSFATSLYENNILLDTALRLASKAYELANKFPIGIIRYFPETGHIPSYYTAQQRVQSTQQAQSSTRALMAAIQMKLGKRPEAIRLARDAAAIGLNGESARLAFTVFNHYRMSKEAFDAKKKIVLLEPENNASLLPELEQAYLVMKPGDDKGWEKERMEVLNTLKADIRNRLNKETMEMQMPVTYDIFQTLDGKNLQKNFGDGKVTVINFWATWCVPCMHEMPYVQNVWDKYKNDSGVQFMIINSGAKNTIDDARNWGGNKTYSFPVFFNTDATIGDKLKFNVIPATYIIDKTGKIRYRFIGFEGPIIQQKIDAAIELVTEKSS